MCQVHTGAYVSLLSRLEKPTIPLATQERIPTTYILNVVPITAHTHDRRQSIGKKETKKRKKRKEKKIKKRKEKTRIFKNEKRKGKERKKDKKSIKNPVLWMHESSLRA